jgi:hypothetical protein
MKLNPKIGKSTRLASVIFACVLAASGMMMLPTALNLLVGMPLGAFFLLAAALYVLLWTLSYIYFNRNRSVRRRA